MLDFGDWNPSLSTSHNISLTGYDANGVVVATQKIAYTTPAASVPRSSSGYGDLKITGDAITASPGQIGNWTWNLSGNGITKVVLEFGAGYDPAIALDLLSFTTECQACQAPRIDANFSQIAVGQSVEGMGVVAPGLDIDAKGTAVKILEGSEPVAYGAPNGNAINNGGLTLDRGFSDIETSNGSWGSSIHLHFCSRDFSKQLFAAYAGLWRLEPKFEHIS